MKEQRNKMYGQQYHAVEEVIQGKTTKLSFTFNFVFLAIAAINFGQLYWAYKHKKINLFVYTSIVIDLTYPFLLKLKRKYLPLKVILLQGTLISSLLYDLWVIAYPHKIFLFYMPMFLGSLGKVYQQFKGQNSQDVTQIVEGLIKFQSKIQVLVVIYAIASFLIKLKFTWSKLFKIVFLIIILKVKYWQHYGTQAAWLEIHKTLDHISKSLLLRQYYQELYAKFSRLSNRHNQAQILIF